MNSSEILCDSPITDNAIIFNLVVNPVFGYNRYELTAGVRTYLALVMPDMCDYSYAIYYRYDLMHFVEIIGANPYEEKLADSELAKLIHDWESLEYAGIIGNSVEYRSMPASVISTLKDGCIARRAGFQV